MKYSFILLLKIFLFSQLLIAQSFDSNVKLLEYDYENEIEKRLTEKLSKLAGEKNVFVNVNMTLKLKEIVKQKGKKGGKPEFEIDYENSLPGFVSLKAKGNKSPSTALVQHKIEISGLIIDIYLNEILPDVVEQEIKAVVENQPFISDIKNVSLNVTKKNFGTEPTKEVEVSFLEKNWTLILFGLIGFLGIFIILSLLKIGTGFKKLGSSIEKISVGEGSTQTKSTSTPLGETIPNLKVASPTSFDDEKIIRKVLPFDFFGNYSVEVLQEVLNKESDERIALFLSLCNFNVRNKILSSLSTKRTANIIKHLSEELKLGREEVNLVAENLKSKIQEVLNPKKLVSGGLNTVIEIMNENLTNPDDIFDELKPQSSELVNLLQKDVFYYEKLGELNEKEISEIVNASDKKDIAFLLLANDNVAQKMKNAMSDRMKSVVKDYLDIIPKDDEEALKNAKFRVVQVAKEMMRG